MGKKSEWFLPLSQVADLLECDLRQVHRLLAAGELAYIRMPDKKIKVSEDSLSAFIGMRRENGFGGGAHAARFS